MIYTNIDDVTATQYKPREELEVVCAVCGEKFYTTKRNKKYCSDECRSEANRRTAIEWAKNNPERHRARSLKASRDKMKLRGNDYYRVRIKEMRELFASNASDDEIIDYLYANFRRKNVVERMRAEKEIANQT